MPQSLSSIATKSLVLLAALTIMHPAMAQQTATTYTKMAPVDQYLMSDTKAEIALARSAAPESISHDAGVLVLTVHRLETAIQSKNGFVCFVGRGWSSAPDADFWNPRVRVPMCLNAAAVRTFLPRIMKMTALALAGNSPARVNEAIIASVASKELPSMEQGAMCYMMSKEGYGGDVIPHWPSHIMFFYSDMKAANWGANLPGSPVLGVDDTSENLTQFVVPVRQWSDGTVAFDSPEHHHP
jgi:hypothetical protein